MDTLYTFWDNITHSKNKSVHFLGLMNSATKKPESLRGSPLEAVIEVHVRLESRVQGLGSRVEVSGGISELSGLLGGSWD